LRATRLTGLFPLALSLPVSPTAAHAHNITHHAAAPPKKMFRMLLAFIAVPFLVFDTAGFYLNQL
jgi:hypothetical protein